MTDSTGILSQILVNDGYRTVTDTSIILKAANTISNG